MSEVIVQEARQLGWVPKEDFRGDPEKWVDAESFVERGKHIMPILRQNNAKLEQTLAQQSAEIARVTRLFEASQESITELQRFHDENTQRQVEKARKDLLTELTQAKKDGNIELEVELTDELAQLTEAQRAVKKLKETEVKATAASTSQPVADPAFAAWLTENTWFNKDVQKTAKALAIAKELRDDPKMAGVVGYRFYAKVSDLMDGGPAGNGGFVDKTEGGSGRRPAGSSATGYDALPAEAKEACTKQAKKLVGEGRAFKDVKSWNEYYAAEYFKGDSNE